MLPSRKDKMNFSLIYRVKFFRNDFLHSETADSEEPGEEQNMEVHTDCKPS